MDTYDWSESRMDGKQLGRYGELLVASELLRYGFDVYSGEVDDRGIDLVVRIDENIYHTLQVKTTRTIKSDNFIYVRRVPMELQAYHWVICVICQQGKAAAIYLIPVVENGAVNPFFRLTEYGHKPAYAFTPTKVIACPHYLFEVSIQRLLR